MGEAVGATVGTAVRSKLVGVTGVIRHSHKGAIAAPKSGREKRPVGQSAQNAWL